MCVGAGRHIKKAVHQHNTQEVQQRLPALMTTGCLVGFICCVSFSDHLREFINQTNKVMPEKKFKI